MKYRYRIKPVKDAPLFEVENPAGESWVDIPDEEINEFAKKRLIEIANNDRLFNKYRKDIVEMLEKELQDYASKEFYEKGRGEMIIDSMAEEDLKEVKEAFQNKIKALWKEFEPQTKNYSMMVEYSTGPAPYDLEEKETTIDLEYWDPTKNEDGFEVRVWSKDRYGEDHVADFPIYMKNFGINLAASTKEECLEQIDQINLKILDEVVYEVIYQNWNIADWS